MLDTSAHTGAACKVARAAAVRTPLPLLRLHDSTRIHLIRGLHPLTHVRLALQTACESDQPHSASGPLGFHPARV